MPNPNSNTIISSVQLLVEGNDQRNFFQAMIEHLSLENVQIQNFGGVNELPVYLSNLAKSIEFYELVDRVGIVRDAETSASSAFQSVQGALRNADLPIPAEPGLRVGDSPSVSVLILPDNDSDGMLETLLCRTLDTEVNHCIDDFFNCVRDATGEELRRPEKARAHAFLTTRPDPHLSVGYAAMRGYWNLNHPAFNQIRTFLNTL